MKTILGTGQLGITVMETLLKVNPNEQITLVNRSGKLEMKAPDNVIVRAADVTNPDHMEKLANGSDILFSCTDVPYMQWNTFYPAAAAALSHAMKKSNAKLVFADNLYSYGNVEGRVMKEDMPHAAHTKKGMIRAAVINVLLNAREEFSQRVAIVKASDFIGPRIHKGILGLDFLRQLYQGKRTVLPGNRKIPHTFTCIGDFAVAMVNVGSAEDAFGQIWHVPNAPAMSLEKWIHLFEVMTGKKAKVVVLPKVMIRLAGLFNPLVREFYEMLYQFEYPYLVGHAKYEARFGIHVTCPSNIVKETVKWYNTTQSK